MLATIRYDTWNVLNTQHLTQNAKRWDYSDILGGGTYKELPTWLKVATTSEIEPHPTPNICANIEQFREWLQIIGVILGLSYIAQLIIQLLRIILCFLSLAETVGGLIVQYKDYGQWKHRRNMLLNTCTTRQRRHNYYICKIEFIDRQKTAHRILRSGYIAIFVYSRTNFPRSNIDYHPGLYSWRYNFPTSSIRHHPCLYPNVLDSN